MGGPIATSKSLSLVDSDSRDSTDPKQLNQAVLFIYLFATEPLPLQFPVGSTNSSIALVHSTLYIGDRQMCCAQLLWSLPDFVTYKLVIEGANFTGEKAVTQDDDTNSM